MGSEYKEPIVGELAIVWNTSNTFARIEEYNGYRPNPTGWNHETNSSFYKNAILFESVEQFKEFINS